MVVTNVPGPQVPMYMAGARMLEMYPHVPLADNLGLGIALLSYDGRIFWVSAQTTIWCRTSRTSSPARAKRSRS